IKLFPTRAPPRKPKLHEVPVRLFDYDSQFDQADLRDLCLSRVSEHINNINHVQRIIDLCDVDKQLVLKTLEHLQYYGCITYLPIFKFSNFYEQLRGVRGLVSSRFMQWRCQEYVAMNANDPPLVKDLITLYSSIDSQRPFKEWVFEHQDLLDVIDLRQMIIRLVEVYPYVDEDNRQLLVDKSGWDKSLVEMLDGTNSIDSIALATGKDTASLKGKFESEADLVELIYR
ncbi:Nitrogen permease regulator 2, partial [Spiromyces aspiralis]